MPLLTIFVTAVFLYSLVSRLVERSPLTSPIIFTTVGVMAALVLQELTHGEANAEAFLTIAELGLVLLLFSEASHIDRRLLRSIRGLPTRLLTTGMVLTIGLGMVVALVLFDQLSIWEAGILAAVLAPTDAGLGQAIVSDTRVPQQIREALSVEAGLNDGLAVPFLLFFIALAGSTASGESASLLGFIVEQIGYGAAIGLVVARGGAWLAGRARQMNWVDERIAKLGFLMMPLFCMLAAHAVHGSAFIAAFVGGLALPRNTEFPGRLAVQFTEDWGQLINLAVFFLFGVLLVAAWPDLRPIHFVYGVLSLTVIRMIPVAIALKGSGMCRATVGFIGWFGPRGLASIVLGLVYVEQVHGATNSLIGLTVTATVLLSVLAHGLTAKPGATWYARAVAALPASAPEHGARPIAPAGGSSDDTSAKT